MFEHWDSFYLLIGSAAAALIGLLFIVATLTAGLDGEQSQRGARVYLTPTVFHLAVSLVVSAVALAPSLTAIGVGGSIAAVSALGLIYSVSVAGQIRRMSRGADAPHWTDFWFYGVLMAVTYLALEAGAISVWAAPASAPCVIGFVLLALLLLGIRNAWDLVTWIAPRAKRV